MQKSEKSSELEIVQLRLPKISREHTIGHVSALRPFRRSGLRFEQEQRGSLRILHNYGHGAWGINLSYGTAVKMVELFEQRQRTSAHKNSPIIVLGSGIVGISTALVLLDKGYRVKLVASEFPSPFQYDSVSKHATQPPLTSQAAAGFVMRFSQKMIASAMTDTPCEGKFTALEIDAVNITQQFFQKCIASKRFKGLRYQKFFDFFAESYESTGFFNDGRYVNVSFANGAPLRRAHLSTIIVADTQYIFSLFEEIKALGAEIVQKKLQKSDLTSEALGSDVLFNCCGLGSLELFDDTDMYPVKGQLIYLKKQLNDQDTENEEFTLFGDSPDKSESAELQFMSHGDKLVLGGVFQKNIWSRQVVQKNIDDIWRRYELFQAQAVPRL